MHTSAHKTVGLLGNIDTAHRQGDGKKQGGSVLRAQRQTVKTQKPRFALLPSTNAKAGRSRREKGRGGGELRSPPHQHHIIW